MKNIYSICALLGLASVQSLRILPENSLSELRPEDNQDLQLSSDINLLAEPCAEPLEISEANLRVELDYFSRRFEKKHYDNAMKIYSELKKKGAAPQLSVHTWELYDKAFSFARVRRFEEVQHHMDLIQHFQDNLNQNFSNGQNVANFIDVCKKA